MFEFSGRYTRLSLVLFALVVCGWASFARAQAPAPPDSALPVAAPAPTNAIESGYRVGPDDEILVRVFGEDDLTNTYTVSTNGNLAMPLIGNFHVEGMSLQELQIRIVTLLKDGYLLNPQVTLEMKKYRPFYILGEVNVPGSYSYVSNMNVLNAVAVAGGFTYRANKHDVDIKRVRGEDTEIIEDEDVESIVAPGDIIIVKERFF